MKEFKENINLGNELSSEFERALIPIFGAEINQLFKDEAARFLQQTIDNYLSHSYDDIEQESVLLGVNGAPVLHRGDISVIQGQVKSGKSAFAAWLAGALLNPDGVGTVIEGAYTESVTTPRVLYFDTEQSQYYSMLHIRQINEVAKTEPGMDAQGLYYINAREYTTIEKIVLLEKAIRELRPDIVLLDGVADLMQDTNSNPEASAICSALMKLVKVYKCHICSVIHQNHNSDKARGHIGSELWRKSESVIQIKKEYAPDGSERFTADFPITRGKQAEALIFARDEHGTPHRQYSKDLEAYKKALQKEFGDAQFTKFEATAALMQVFPKLHKPSVEGILTKICQLERVGQSHKVMYKIS